MPYIMYVALQGDDKLARFSMDPDYGQAHVTGGDPCGRRPGPAGG